MIFFMLLLPWQFLNFYFVASLLYSHYRIAKNIIMVRTLQTQKHINELFDFLSKIYCEVIKIKKAVYKIDLR